MEAPSRRHVPEPLGPVTRRLVPRGTRSVRSLTSVALAGVTTFTPSNAISPSDATMFSWPSVSACNSTKRAQDQPGAEMVSKGSGVLKRI